MQGPCIYDFKDYSFNVSTRHGSCQNKKGEAMRIIWNKDLNPGHLSNPPNLPEKVANQQKADFLTFRPIWVACNEANNVIIAATRSASQMRGSKTS